MIYTIGYGKDGQTFEIPKTYDVECINPNKIEKLRIKKYTVEEALDNPIGTKILEEIIKPKDKIVIVTSDITRPMPSYKVLPSILKRLEKTGVKKENISIIFALGSHRKHTKEEKIKLVGEEVYKSIICKDSSEEDFINMGKTSCGTPILINKTVAEADIRICLGNIEYHYFAGYSGGAKAIMPGVSNREAIQSNHSKMVEKGAEVGRLEDNPVRLDIEEAVKFCNIDFILNVILDEKKEIVHAVAGDYIKAHREGCHFLDKLYMKKIKEKADIVIASQGGYPKDLNLYQTQKALANAVFAVKEGGIIILVGSCIEGFGEHVFETWMKDAKSPEETIKRVRVDFQLGGHKAAAIGLVLQKADIYLVSEMDRKTVRDIFMHPYKKIQKALDEAIKKKGKDAKIIIMPYAGSTLPVLNNIKHKKLK